MGIGSWSLGKKDPEPKKVKSKTLSTEEAVKALEEEDKKEEPKKKVLPDISKRVGKKFWGPTVQRRGDGSTPPPPAK